MSIEEKEVIAEKLKEKFGGNWYWDTACLSFKCDDTGRKVTKYQLSTKKVVL